MSALGVTFHAVLAGAYKGKALRSLELGGSMQTLVHASLNGMDGPTLCRRVKEGSLCDVEEPRESLSCEACKRKLARLEKQTP